MQSYAQFFFFRKRSGTSFFLIFCAWFLQKSCTKLTDQIALSDCLYFLRYWSICVLQLFVNQAVTSQILELTVVM